LEAEVLGCNTIAPSP